MFTRKIQLAIKRALDIIVSLAILAVMWPILLLIALAIKCTSKGPALFLQERVGYNARIFHIYKFRTMNHAPDHKAIEWSKIEEMRITKVGKFLRDYGLDELPQLINILKGDMSIIGPRPPLAIYLGNFTERQRTMFRMRPGVLSLAAVSGRRSISMDERTELHMFYVDNWSLSMDVKILWRSLSVVLFKRDAFESSGRKP